MLRLLKSLSLAGAALLITGATTASAGLYFSEYIEGSSFNKCVEIYNGTGGDVNLADVTLRLYSNGAVSPTSSATLSGTLAAGDVWVVCNPSIADPSPADVLSGTVNYNGDDAFVLEYQGVPVDVIGQIGFDPGTTWGTAPTTTVDATLRRMPTVCDGDAIGSDPFDPSVQWLGFPVNTLDGLGTHDGCGAVSNDEHSWSTIKSLFQ